MRSSGHRTLFVRVLSCSSLLHVTVQFVLDGLLLEGDGYRDATMALYCRTKRIEPIDTACV